MLIGKRIVRARKAAGFKRQIDLAKKLGVARSVLCSWESGKHVPRLPTLRRLASALRVDIAELLG